MTCVLSLGRNGDVINSLPCVHQIQKTEGSCAVMISAEFASVLDGCSYATPIIFDGHFMDTNGAIIQAQKQFERVLVGRVCERGENKCESFNEESFRQLGFLEQFRTLPLIFDQRDAAREDALLKQHTNGQPFALYNVSGKSSPVPNGEQWIQRNKDRIAPGVRWVNLGEIKAHRIYDLIGLMDKAVVLVTGDTSTAHLAAASKVPTINLIADKPTLWHGSKPRNNSLAAWRYSEMPQLVNRHVAMHEPISAIRLH